MGLGQDFVSGQQLLSQSRGESKFFPHPDIIMTNAPFTYSTSVPEVKQAAIKQTMKKQNPDEVIHGYDRVVMPRIIASRRIIAVLLLYLPVFRT